MRRWPPLALACALVLAGPAVARFYSIDDQLRLEQLGPVKLAPGGRWGVIQTFAPWDQAARYDLDWWSTYGLGRLQRVDLRDGATRPLLPFKAGSGYVAGPFSPSGAKMAVCRLTGHAWELGVVTLASGKVRWLGLSPELPLWGRSVAWRTDDELVVIAQPDHPVGHRLGYGWQAQARLSRSWRDAAAGRLAVNVMGSGRYRDLRPRGPPKHLVSVRVSTGRTHVLAQGEFIDLEIAPDARIVAAAAFGEDLQPSDKPATTSSPARRRVLTLIDLDSGASFQPCPHCDVTSNLPTGSALGDRQLERSGQAHLPLASDETLLIVSPEATVAIVSRSDSHGVQQIILRELGRPDRALATLNGGLEALPPADIRPIRHQGPDGQMLTSWLYLPPGLRPGEKAPLVVVPYPGEKFSSPPDNQAPGALRLYANAQVLAGAGYAVLIPSLPYLATREPMAGLAQQVLTVVDAAAAQSPVDIGRLAVWGHSYGGYAALALATQSSRFKAVIASAALSDLASNYGSLSAYSYAVPEGGLSIFASAGWSETGQARMAAPPWKDPERYRRNSPISFADRITAPVMLIHGDMDGGVGQAQEMFTALYRQNKDAVLALYRGESHVILGPANVRDEYARVFQFLADHIGPGVTPGG